MIPVLLHTKYQLPQTRPSLIHRSNLHNKLATGLGRKLTLVSAPAGFGKTTLITSYINQNRPNSLKSHWCWLSLDENDNDPARFFSYIIAALRSANPTIGQPAEALLTAPQLAAIEPIIILLTNELSQQSEDFILVLDDYHFITTPAIHKALAFWLDHLPPNFHLIMTTRTDPPLPLPRMRVRGELNEIRAADLQVTTAETAEFLHQMSGTTLSPEEINALVQRTEGWFAGLQLAALSIKDQTDIPAFIQAFTGSHVYILDYLAHEVLRQLPDDVLHFLQDTAVLDRLSPALCNAVTGRPDSENLLRQLYARNLFLEALDDNLHWYRFHALFREVLMLQLRRSRPEDIPRLHRRACDWFVQAGQINQALHHAFAAEDISLAATLVEEHAMAYVNRSEYYTIRSWLEQLPPAVRHASPRIILVEGFLLTVTGKHKEVQNLLSETAVIFEDPQLPAGIRGEWAHLKSILNRFMKKEKESIQYGNQALDLLPAEMISERNKVILNLLMDHFTLGNSDEIDSLLDRLKDDNSEIYLIASFYKPFVAYYRGHLNQSAKTYQDILAKILQTKHQPFLALGFIYCGLGQIAYEWGDFSEAISYLIQGIDHLKKSIEQITIPRAVETLAMALLGSGEKQAAFQVFEEIAAWPEQMQIVDLGFGPVLAYQQARVYLQLGDVESAVRTVSPHKLPPLSVARSDEYLIYTSILLAQNRPHEAIKLLEEIGQKAKEVKFTGIEIEVECQLAINWSAVGESSAALDCLNRIMPHAEQQGYRRTFIDKGEPMRHLLHAYRRQHLDNGRNTYYIDQLLGDFPQESASQPAPDILPEPLTDRETEILGWVATGASNKDIAEQLFISPTTVKKHLTNIFVKLDVNSRTQAAARGREIGLIF